MNRVANLAAIAALLLTSSAATSGPTASVSTSADAEVLAGTVNFTSQNPLAFGRIKSTGPGTVIVTVTPQRTSTGDVTLIGSGSCVNPPCDFTNQSNQNSASFWSPAILTLTGTPNTAYRVIVNSTASAVLKSGSSAPTTLQVTGVNAATSSSTYSSNIGTLDSSGQGTVRIGGTLQVTVALNASSYYLYSVDVPVTIVYN